MRPRPLQSQCPHTLRRGDKGLSVGRIDVLRPEIVLRGPQQTMWTSTTKLLIAKNLCCRPVNNGKGYQSCVSGAATKLSTGRHDLRRGQQTVSARRQGLSARHHDLCAREQALSAGPHHLSRGPTRMYGGQMTWGAGRLEQAGSRHGGGRPARYGSVAPIRFGRCRIVCCPVRIRFAPLRLIHGALRIRCGRLRIELGPG